MGMAADLKKKFGDLNIRGLDILKSGAPMNLFARAPEPEQCGKTELQKFLESVAWALEKAGAKEADLGKVVRVGTQILHDSCHGMMPFVSNYYCVLDEVAKGYPLFAHTIYPITNSMIILRKVCGAFCKTLPALQPAGKAEEACKMHEHSKRVKCDPEKIDGI